MKVSELLAVPERVSELFAGVDTSLEVRVAVQPGTVEVVAEPAPATEPQPQTAPPEQKEG